MSKMRIACLSSTKNEGDVIEAFVRLNGRVCTSFFFADESTDRTREILSLMAKEGYDVRYLPVAPWGYNQPRSARAYLTAVREQIDPDWIFLLDADEIIVPASDGALIREMQSVASRTYLTAEWKTYVPTTLGYFESSSPLSECFALRSERGEVYSKISIPGCLADEVTPTAGNHTATSSNRAPVHEQAAKSYHLAHFPVRSAAQLIVKNLIATHNLTTRVDALQGEGIHVGPILERIRTRNYELTLEDLQDIALSYGYTASRSRVGPEDFIPSDRSKLRTELRYSDIARINVVGRLDAEIERLSMEIRRRNTRGMHNAVYVQARRDT